MNDVHLFTAPQGSVFEQTGRFDFVCTQPDGVVRHMTVVLGDQPAVVVTVFDAGSISIEIAK